jgi:preprotein translocase subunit SecF
VVWSAEQIRICELLIRIKAADLKRWQDTTLRIPAAENAMLSLMMTLFSMIATTTMGIAVVVALTMGLDTWQPLVIAAAIGFLVAVPISWLVAKNLP